MSTRGVQSKWYLLVAGLVIAAVGIALNMRVSAVPQDDPKSPFARTFKLPAEALDGGVEWLNTAGPMPLPKLRGKIVLLDFWTYCCINCIHIIADLEKLESEFANELVVIGVHSPKFVGERDSENIKSAIARYDIRHPVINDANHAIWQKFGVNSWPTLVLIDPEGAAVRIYSGEGNYQDVRDDIKKLIEYHSGKKTLDRTPLHIETVMRTEDKTPLRYPGKVVVDPGKNRIAIADSSHHRVVLAKLDTGEVQHVIGNGTPALKNGDFSTARFNDPQGMAFDGDKLWVADRKNHALRLIDLEKKTVATVAGNGNRGFDRFPQGTGNEVALASPWDLLIVDGVMYIANAGTHQIWSMKMSEPGAVRNFAGNGRENIRDGFRDESNFAQPSGLASDGEWLYVADSETSSVRAIGLKQDSVKTLVGTGLFDFGDTDGRGKEARLQHALGVAFHDGIVYVADTYNNRLKTIDNKSNVSAWIGDRKAGSSDDPPRFDEPGGIHFAAGKLYVADTNNHQIRVVDVKSKAVSTFRLKGLEPPIEEIRETSAPTSPPIKLPAPVAVAEGPIVFSATLNVPSGSKLNPNAPMGYKIWCTDGGKEELISKGKITSEKMPVEITLAPDARKGASKLRLAITYFPCETGSEGVCKVMTSSWELELTTGKNDGNKVALPTK